MYDIGAVFTMQGWMLQPLWELKDTQRCSNGVGTGQSCARFVMYAVQRALAVRKKSCKDTPDNRSYH